MKEALSLTWPTRPMAESWSKRNSIGALLHTAGEMRMDQGYKQAPDQSSVTRLLIMPRSVKAITKPRSAGRKLNDAKLAKRR